MSVIKELKDFMMRGNVVDMAVGIIIGGAFGKIVSSLVSDVIMPPIGFILNGVDFSDLKLVISQATADSKVVAINYGAFLQTVLDFMIISTVIFFAIKGMNTLRSGQDEVPAGPPAPTKEELLLAEIRDLLKDQNSK